MKNWYLAYPTLAILIWTGSPIAAKLSVNVVEPAQIAFLRWLIAFVILSPLVLPSFIAARKDVFPHWLTLLVLSFLGMVTYQSLAYFAAPYTSATNIGLLNASIPIFSIMIEAIAFRKRQSPKVILGCIIAFIGVVVLVSQGEMTSLFRNHVNFGDFLILVSCLSYALYSVLVGRIAPGISRWHSLYAQIGFAVVLLLPGFLLSGPVAISPNGALIILYVGIPASIFAPFFWMQGVRYLGSARTSAFLNVVPITTLVAASLLLGEPLAPFQIVGGFLALAGVLLSQA
ncbi:DMT family transporter [Agrobacterium sp. LAD9]|uniref:DMT family transporter n=1 Tax=Agrobacterium sp. LAD9 TaxID=2055153 RepID=UPI000D1EB7EF|nr:DMT family transporter [Agrobacterium sp. LAD9]